MSVMLKNMFPGLALSMLFIVSVYGYGHFRDRIPNGHNVPHPCKTSSLWQGVGHKKREGGGYRNVFGIDFKDANLTWTKTLCEKDSDGDGLSNGQELGDPGCTWSYGDDQPIGIHISHPGICEPWNDPKCQRQLSWLASACGSDEFVCDALNDTDIYNITLQFPPTSVPSAETTYMCMEFDLEESGEYHLVATKPIIDNSNIMHHAVLFGCKSANHAIRSTPHRCGMVASRECDQILSIWTLGSSGNCFHDRVGFRIGSSGYKRAALQFHWNNPTLKTDYQDQSGMILYYTSNLRANDAGVFTIGAGYLKIPGRTASTQQTCLCPGTCTSSFIKDKVFVVSAFNHMHYLGRSQKIELFRNDTKIRDITNDEQYNYDSPVVHIFSDPIEVLPGDTFSTTCDFNSLLKEETTYFGDATSSEMCYGFITYYPKDTIKRHFCTAWKSIPECELWSGLPFRGCDATGFFSHTGVALRLVNNINTNCQTDCSSDCMTSITKLYDHECMQGDLNDYFSNLWSLTETGRNFIKLSKYCLQEDRSVRENGTTLFQLSVFFLLTNLLVWHTVV